MAANIIEECNEIAAATWLAKDDAALHAATNQDWGREAWTRPRRSALTMRIGRVIDFARTNPRSADEISHIARLEAGWAGPNSAPISEQAIKAARVFHALLRVGARPSISPTSDGDVMFEWELADGSSLYAHAQGDGLLAIVYFDDEHDFVNVKLPPSAAARVVAALLSVS